MRLHRPSGISSELDCKTLVSGDRQKTILAGLHFDNGLAKREKEVISRIENELQKRKHLNCVTDELQNSLPAIGQMGFTVAGKET